MSEFLLGLGLLMVLQAGLLAGDCSTEKAIDMMRSNDAIFRIHSPDSSVEAGILAAVGGRVVFFGSPGGRNLLNSDPAKWDPAAHVVPEPDAGFKEFNGHIVWLSPQADWWNQQEVLPGKRGDNWPPDPYMIYGTYEVMKQGASHIHLCGPESPVSGVKVCKTYTFTGPRTLELTTVLTNVREAPVSWGIWSNTRLDPAVRFYVAMEGRSDEAARYDDPDGFRGRFLARGHWFTFGEPLPEAEINNKVYLSTQLAWVGIFHGDWLWVKEVANIKPSEVHPSQAPVEVYIRSGGKASRLLELEFHGPYTEIEPGEAIALTETWTLHEASASMTEEDRLAMLTRLRATPEATR